MYILLRRALHTKIQDYNASPDIFSWYAFSSTLQSLGWNIKESKSPHLHNDRKSLLTKEKKSGCHVGQCVIHWLFAFRVSLLTCLFLLLLHDFSISEIQKIKDHIHIQYDALCNSMHLLVVIIFRCCTFAYGQLLRGHPHFSSLWDDRFASWHSSDGQVHADFPLQDETSQWT